MEMLFLYNRSKYIVYSIEVFHLSFAVDSVPVMCCRLFPTAGPSPVLPAPVPVSDSHEASGLSGAVPLSVPVSQPLEDNDLMGDELDSLLDCMSKEEDTPQVRRLNNNDTECWRCSLQFLVGTFLFLTQSGVVPTGLVCFSSSTPRLPPAFFSSVGSHLNSLDTFTKTEMNSDSSSSTLDALDSICPSADTVSLQRPLVVGGDALDSLSEFSLPGLCIQIF